jgi:hypothetical protein
MPRVKTVLAHWNDIRGGRRMPRWADIQPRAIAAKLPIVWSYKYDHTTGTFTGRLAGARIAHLFGKSFPGLPLAEGRSAMANGV